MVSLSTLPANFYPRPPCGGRPDTAVLINGVFSHFYPRPPCGGRRQCSETLSSLQIISIHALRVEGDLFAGLLGVIIHISIHALRVEGDAQRSE